MHTEKGTDHNTAARQIFPNITQLCNQHPDQDTAHSQCPKDPQLFTVYFKFQFN